MIIYKITNLITQKIYVGQTTKSVEQRFKEHSFKSNKCSYLKHAFDLHGKENFKIEILQVCNSIQELNDSEVRWIKELNSLAPAGYNLQEGGYSGKPCDIVKKKISLKNKGRKASLETRIKLSKRSSGANNPRYGVKLSEETKLKISIAHTGKKRGPSKLRGRKHSEETKLKMSNASKGNTYSRGTKKSPEFKEACRQRAIKNNKKMVIDLISGFIFESAQEAAASIGIKYSTLSSMLNDTNRNKTTLCYIL